MGHGYYTERFPEIEIPLNCEIRFYVPEMELYDCTWSHYYIWNNGEAISGIELIPDNIKKLEVGPPAALSIHRPGERIKEHLLFGLEWLEIQNDLEGVNRILLDGNEIKEIWAPYSFNVLHITSVTPPTNGLEEREKENQYVVTPAWKPIMQGYPNRGTIFRLSWLINRIFELREVRRHVDEPIRICWLACREEYDELNPFAQNIKRIYPEEP